MGAEPEYDSAEQDTLVGTALEQYEILQKIGEGSIGTIYRGRDTSSDRDVAIKFLTREVTSKPQILARFKREIQTAIKMRHPNIVRGFSAGVWEGCIYYYVMEFVDGPTLQDLLSRQRVTEAQAVKIAVQIASALQYIHEFGMVHRDLKPENIMLDSKGVAKLADLGLAKDINDISGLTMVGTIIGTPLYMSPEQAKGAAVIDIRSDIYSLGATLFHMVTGEPPFKGKTAPEVIAKQIEETAAPVRDLNPSLSPGLEYILHKMLEKDPAARHQTPRDLLDDLQLLMEGKGESRDPDLPWSAEPVRQEAEFLFSFIPGDEDFEYALTAVANRLLDPGPMMDVLDFQEAMARHGVALKLPHIAVERGAISPDANRKILDAQGRQREMEQGTGIGKLAVRKGIATQEQIDEAVRSQGALRKEGKIRLLGEILKENQVLDEEGLQKLLALQTQIKFGKEDRQFLELARRRRLVTGPVADKTVLIQKNEIAMSRYRRLGDILVERKFIAPAARDACLRAIRRSQLTGEDLDALMDEKSAVPGADAPEEVPVDEALLKKYRNFIRTQLKAGKALRTQRKFREAMDAWRAILEVLVTHPEAERAIRDTESVLENMDGRAVQARKHLHMALKEWEGVLRIDPGYPPAVEDLQAANDRIRKLLGAVGHDPGPAETALAGGSAPGADEPEDRDDGDEGGDDATLRRALRAAKRFEKQGSWKEARKKYGEVLALDPGQAEAAAALKGLHRRDVRNIFAGCALGLVALVVAGAAAYVLIGERTCLPWIWRALLGLRALLG